MKINLTYTSQMNELKRKLIGMPITFTEVEGKPEAIQVEVKTGYEAIFKHALSGCVMMDSLKEVFDKHLEEMGYTDSFKDSYFDIAIARELIIAPWMVSLSKKVHALIEETLETDAVMDVPMMVQFNLHSEKEMIEQFAILCDTEVAEGVVDHLSEPLFSETYKDLYKETPKKNITIQVDENNELQLSVDDGSGLVVSEYKDAFFSEDEKQKIYLKDSPKLKSIKDLIIIILLTKLFSIESLIIEDEGLFKQLTYFFNKYDIKTKVVGI